jgi:hypothetical protein
MDQEVETWPEVETCPGESVSARLTDLVSRDPPNFPQADPIFSVKSMAPACNAAPGRESGDTNARIVKFSKDGKFIKTWGKKGSAPR